MKETKEIQEEVQIIRKDRKAIEVLGNWYQSPFKKTIPENIQKGDIVKIKFQENKGFNNIVSIEKIEAETTKPVVCDNRKDQIAGMLTSYCKDILITEIQCSQPQDLEKYLDKISDSVIKTYNKIKQELR